MVVFLNLVESRHVGIQTRRKRHVVNEEEQISHGPTTFQAFQLSLLPAPPPLPPPVETPPRRCLARRAPLGSGHARPPRPIPPGNLAPPGPFFIQSTAPKKFLARLCLESIILLIHTAAPLAASAAVAVAIPGEQLKWCAEWRLLRVPPVRGGAGASGGGWVVVEVVRW